MSESRRWQGSMYLYVNDLRQYDLISTDAMAYKWLVFAHDSNSSRLDLLLHVHEAYFANNHI